MTDPTADVSIVKLTPADAKRILETNEVNRNVRVKLVNAYRRDMEHGRWEFTGEPIQISVTGRLLNGQHRLLALRDAEGVESLTFVMVTGVPDPAQSMMDQGKPRTARDALIIEHGQVKNVTIVASVARWIAIAGEPGPHMNPSLMRTKTTTAEILEVYNKYPEIEEFAALAGGLRQHLIGSPSAIAYTWFYLDQVDSEACYSFFHGMADLSFNQGGDPRKAALRRMQILHTSQEVKTSLETGVMMVSVLTRAWNAWRRGEDVESLAVRSRSGLILPVKPV